MQPADGEEDPELNVLGPLQFRFEGQFRLWTEQREPLGYPPTNYLIVGEKVEPDHGVLFRPAAPAEPLGFLEFTCYEHKEKRLVRELVRRPNLTVDTLPYFEEGGELYILARKSYPRPLLSLCDKRLDGALSPTYVTEPVTVIAGDKPLAQTVEEALIGWAGMPSDDILEFAEGSTTYPSPGGVQEEIHGASVIPKRRDGHRVQTGPGRLDVLQSQLS